MPDEHALDVLYRLQERYRRRVEEGDPGAPPILTAIEQLIEDHEARARRLRQATRQESRS